MLSAIKYIHNYWTDTYHKHDLLRLRLGVHKGGMLLYRRFCGGESFNASACLESVAKHTSAYNDNNNIVITHVSDIIMKEALKVSKSYKNNFSEVTQAELKKFKCPSRAQNVIKTRFKSTYIFNPDI